MTVDRVAGGPANMSRRLRCALLFWAICCIFAPGARGAEDATATAATDVGEAEKARHWPGLDRAAELLRRREEFPAVALPAPQPLAAPGMIAAASPTARPTWDLAEGWTQLPVAASGELREPKRVTLPAAWGTPTGTHAARPCKLPLWPKHPIREHGSS